MTSNKDKLAKFHVPGNPAFARLLRNLKKLFATPYTARPTMDDDDQWPIVTQTEEDNGKLVERQKAYDKAMAGLKDHVAIIEQFGGAIDGFPNHKTGESWAWPNDPPNRRQIEASNSVVISSRSSSKWARQVGEENGSLGQQSSSKWRR